MKIAERIVIVTLFLILIGGAAWIYFAVQQDQREVLEAVARGEYEQPIETEKQEVALEDWRTVYPNAVPILVGGVEVEASVADTLSKRIKGLSGTPFLPDKVVKLFAFGVEGVLDDLNIFLVVVKRLKGLSLKPEVGYHVGQSEVFD